MRKFLIGTVAAAFVFGMAVPLFAAEVTIGGHIRFRGRYWQDLDLSNRDNFASAAAFPPAFSAAIPGGFQTFNSDINLNNNSTPSAAGARQGRSRLDERIRLSVDAKIVEGLRAYFEFEDYYGVGQSTPNSGGGVVGGSGGCSGAGAICGAGTPYFRFAWLDAVIPGTPIHAKLGRQAFTLGHGLAFDTSSYGGDAYYLYSPFGPGTFGFAGVKITEQNFGAGGGDNGFRTDTSGTTPRDHDQDVFFVHYKFAPIQGHLLEPYVIWNRDNSKAAGTAGIASGYRVSEYTFGVAYDGTVGPWGFRFDLAGQTGDSRKFTSPNKTPAANAGLNDISRSSGMVWLGVNYSTSLWGLPMTPEFNFAYGSGDKRDAACNPAGSGLAAPAAASVANANCTGNKNQGFFNEFWSTGLPFLIAGDDAPGNPPLSPLGGVNGRVYSVGGLENLMFFSIQNPIKVRPDLTVNPFITYLRAPQDYHPNGTTGGGKSLGWEFDLRTTWRPYKNLSFDVWLGTLAPGNYFKCSLNCPGGESVSPRAAYQARWHAIVSF